MFSSESSIILIIILIIMLYYNNYDSRNDYINFIDNLPCYSNFVLIVL